MKVVVELEITGDFNEEEMDEDEKEEILEWVIDNGAETVCMTGKIVRVIEFK